MERSKRLETILSLVPEGCVPADIGTDHGFLPIELIRRGIVSRAFAMDVREGPLDRAREHTKEAGMTGQIQLRLSDGFAALSPPGAPMWAGGVSRPLCVPSGGEKKKRSPGLPRQKGPRG